MAYKRNFTFRNTLIYCFTYIYNITDISVVIGKVWCFFRYKVHNTLNLQNKFVWNEMSTKKEQIFDKSTWSKIDFNFSFTSVTESSKNKFSIKVFARRFAWNYCFLKSAWYLASCKPIKSQCPPIKCQGPQISCKIFQKCFRLKRDFKKLSC